MEPRDDSDDGGRPDNDAPSPCDPIDPPPGGDQPVSVGSVGAPARPRMAQLLVQMAEEQYRLIRGDDGRTYAIPKLGPAVAVPLGSKAGNGMRAKLATSMRRTTGSVPSGKDLSDAINVLQGEAAELDPRPVYLRMAPLHHTTDEEGSAQSGVVVDMGTETGQALVVTCDGWQIQASPPVVFRRSELTHPLVTPARGGSLDGLRDLVNLCEEDFRLAIGWLAAGYLVDIPHPILLVYGEQGSAKSSLVRTLLSLLDPQPAADRAAPANQREWGIFARASWAFSFDNVTAIPAWLSNALCKGVTGDAVLQRMLHTDEDIAVFAFQRVMAITTVALKHPLAGDLADRMLLIEPDVLDQRLPETTLRARRAAVLPTALGAVLDLVAAVLAHLPAVQVTALPRMADFARVLAALDAATGWHTLASYRKKITAISMALIEGDTFAHALYQFATPTPWEGTTTQLLDQLHRTCALHRLPAGELPATVQAAGVHLTEIAPALRKVGVDIRRRKTGPRRILHVIKHPTRPDT